MTAPERMTHQIELLNAQVGRDQTEIKTLLAEVSRLREGYSAIMRMTDPNDNPHVPPWSRLEDVRQVALAASAGGEAVTTRNQPKEDSTMTTPPTRNEKCGGCGRQIVPGFTHNCAVWPDGAVRTTPPTAPAGQPGWTVGKAEVPGHTFWMVLDEHDQPVKAENRGDTPSARTLLIAAAPDLLAALEVAYNLLNPSQHWDECKQVRAALSAAKPGAGEGA